MIVGIDPGLSKSPGGTGWALFESKSGCSGIVNLLPEKVGILRPSGISWVERADSICRQLEVMLNGGELSGVSRAYIELPTFFASTKGMTCATGKEHDDSDLVKLAFLVGEIRHTFYMFGIRCTLVRVNEWKGTLSKIAVERRVAKRLRTDLQGLKSLGIDSHAVDAVGICLYAQGRFKAG
jgi:hypothetical protein